MGLEVGVPRLQRLVIIGTKIVHVLYHEQAQNSGRDFTKRRQVAVRENVFVLPGIDGGITLVLPDRMQQK